jgi:hypothetical protein
MSTKLINKKTTKKQKINENLSLSLSLIESYNNNDIEFHKAIFPMYAIIFSFFMYSAINFYKTWNQCCKIAAVIAICFLALSIIINFIIFIIRKDLINRTLEIKNKEIELILNNQSPGEYEYPEETLKNIFMYISLIFFFISLVLLTIITINYIVI